MSTESESTRSIPPYGPYTTFQSFLRSLGYLVPSRIDRSLMRSMSGTQQAQLISALRFLKLTDAYGNPTQTLEHLATSDGTEHQQVLQSIVKGAYTFLFDDAFDLERATQQQLVDRFRQAGVSGDTVRKCIAFFISIAKEGDVKMSSYIASGGATTSTSSPKASSKASPKKRPSKVATAKKRAVTSPTSTVTQSPIETASPVMAQDWRQLLLEKFPELDPAWPNDVKAQWFEAFQRLLDMTTAPEVHTTDIYDDDILTKRLG